MVKEARPEAVTIAAPTAEHETIAVDILGKGVHVLIEKPIAASLGGALSMIEAAARHNCHLMVGHIVRFNPAIRELKRRLEAGELGRIYQVMCRRIGPFPERIRDVGVVIDLAPHDLDIMRYLIGADPIRVYAETAQRIHTAHEDLLVGLLRFPGNITGGVEINWLSPSKIREILVLGEAGLFKVDDLTQDLYFYENSALETPTWPGLLNLKGVSEGEMRRFPIQRQEPLKAELESFITAILNHRPVAVSGEDGLAALKLALALVESGRTHQVITID
jgi:predicted dehydrogenase